MIPIKGNIRPIKDHILATDMNFGEMKTEAGIILRSDDGKSEGIKPRWCKVWSVGPEQTEIKVGDWILVEHGRWTRGVKVLTESGEEIEFRRIDANGVIGISNEAPTGIQLGSLTTPTSGQTYDFSDVHKMM